MAESSSVGVRRSQRFNELKRLIPRYFPEYPYPRSPGIVVSTLVQRTVFPTIPIKVEYAPTEDGKRLDREQVFSRIWLVAKGAAAV
jgi:hypothetical protein